MAVSALKQPETTDREPGVPAHQFYFTHCTKEGSAVGRAGYGIRAKSAQSPQIERFVDEFPKYTTPANGATFGFPRRLALVEAPANQTVLVHSCASGRDTLNRAGNHFSHFLVYGERPTLAAAARSWGAPEWRTSYPPDESSQLERFDGIPRSELLVDELLEDYLAERCRPTGTEADAIVPSRLAGDRDRRWTLLEHLANACLFSLDPQRRRRVYVNAEPGLLALLLYGVARLVPEELLGGVTFSTFEERSRVAEFKHALIVGTFGSPTEPLDDPRLARQGYVVDTVSGRDSEPLAEAAVPRLRILFELAAAGRWDQLDSLHDLFRTAGEPSVERLEETLALYENSPALFDSDPSPEAVARALLVSRENRLLRRILSLDQPAALQPRRRLWAACIKDPSARKAFADVLATADCRDALQAEVQRLLDADAHWVAYWKLLASTVPEVERTRRFAALLDGRNWENHADQTRLDTALEWSKLDASPERVPPEHAGVLQMRSGEGVQRFLDHEQLPAVWRGQAAALNLLDPDRPGLPSPLVARIQERLLKGGKFADGFLTALVGREPSVNGRLFLAIAEADPKGIPRLLALFDERNLAYELDGERLDEKMSDAGPWGQGDWDDTARLATLTRLLPREGRTLPRVWSHYCSRLDRELLRGDEKQRERFRALERIRHQHKGRVPADAVRDLEEWGTLLKGRGSRIGSEAAQSLLSRPNVLAASLALVAGLVVGWFATAVLFGGGTSDSVAAEAAADTE